VDEPDVTSTPRTNCPTTGVPIRSEIVTTSDVTVGVPTSVDIPVATGAASDGVSDVRSAAVSVCAGKRTAREEAAALDVILTMRPANLEFARDWMATAPVL
jgi:hypothetical protein